MRKGESKMVSRRWSVGVQIIVILGGLSTGWAEPAVNAKITDYFKVNWSSVSYDKTLNNPKVSSEKQQVSERLSLSCEVEILKPDLTLGTSREGVITQLTDRSGRNIDAGTSSSVQSRMMRIPYEGLRYRTRFVQPPQPSRWLAYVRSILRLPRRARSRPEPVSELQPSEIRVQLDTGLRERAEGEIGRIKGYFYALVAESIKYVEVPFEPNSNWVRLTGGLEIQVVKAQCTGSSYQYEIATRSQGQYDRMLSAGDSVPRRIVMGRQFIGRDGKPIRHYSGYRRMPASAGGRGSGSGSRIGQVKTIRYMIAVNPAHYKIPFELEHIPLPKP
jgi:hypothetical protein